MRDCLVDAKSTDKYPYRKEAVGILRQTHRRGRGNAKMQWKWRDVASEGGKAKEFSPRASEESRALPTP